MCLEVLAHFLRFQILPEEVSVPVQTCNWGIRLQLPPLIRDCDQRTKKEKRAQEGGKGLVYLSGFPWIAWEMFKKSLSFNLRFLHLFFLPENPGGALKPVNQQWVTRVNRQISPLEEVSPVLKLKTQSWLHYILVCCCNFSFHCLVWFSIPWSTAIRRYWCIILISCLIAVDSKIFHYIWIKMQWK